jgi:hypothetical protein
VAASTSGDGDGAEIGAFKDDDGDVNINNNGGGGDAVSGRSLFGYGTAVGIAIRVLLCVMWRNAR